MAKDVLIETAPGVVDRKEAEELQERTARRLSAQGKGSTHYVTLKKKTGG